MKALHIRRMSDAKRGAPRGWTGTGLSRYIRQSKDADLPSSVLCWCFKCKENTITVDKTRTWIDLEPRYTIGNLRYVLRFHKCENCSSCSHFIPKESTIPYLPPERLDKFHQSYNHLALEEAEEILNEILSSVLGKKVRRARATALETLNTMGGSERHAQELFSPVPRYPPSSSERRPSPKSAEKRKRQHLKKRISRRARQSMIRHLNQ